MKIKRIKIKKVNNKSDLEEALKLRRKVFIDEQDVPVEIEIDEYDDLIANSIHFLAEHQGQAVGTCRLVMKGEIIKLGRMAIDVNFRQQGIGSSLLEEVIDYSRRCNFKQIILHAQKDAVGFYQNNGFNLVSEDIILEANIEHLKMNKILRKRL